jgi:hypothetical protein
MKVTTAAAHLAAVTPEIRLFARVFPSVDEIVCMAYK